ncbi:hypothetical protein LCGC14_0825490 [marine sediment metagenome]|uniref:Tip attachment protein J domain-containing protein n=1 Tax=marine sediment metagenome TaxID=412755 RepID=A0A0F9PMB2_9ZZZZ
MIIIRTISNIIDMTGRETFKVKKTEKGSLSDYTPAKFVIYKQDRIRVIYNGKAIPPSYRKHIKPKDNSEIIFALELRDPVTAFIWTVIKWAAISYAVGKVTNFLIGAPEQESIPMYSSAGDSVVYGWDGIKNTSRNGQVIAVVYGEHKVGGQIIRMFNRSPGSGKSELSMLIALSEGEVNSITGLAGSTFTVTIASPGVISLTGHGLSIGDSFYVTTTGALPTNMSADTLYYVITAGYGANTFQFAAMVGGTAINTSGSQSGVHTLRKDILESSNIPSDIKINNNAASSYNGVKVYTRPGTNTQPKIEAFRDITSNYVKNLTLAYDTPVSFNTAGSIKAYELNILFWEGLFVRGAGPALPLRDRAVSVAFSIRHKKSGGSWSTPETFTVTEYTYAPITKTYRKDGLELGVYEIEITRTTRDDAWLNANMTYGTHWGNTLYGNHYSATKLYDENEVAYDDLIYPNVALLGIKAMATDQLSGGTPIITSKIKGKKVDVWNEDEPATFTNQWTDNPAWCLLDLLLSSRYGLGEYISVDDIDLQSFQDWADYCDGLVKDGDVGSTFTVTIASPGVISLTGHGLSIGDAFIAETTGALPTGMVVDTLYYVITAGYGANAFQFSATAGGAAINITGSQSGTHTLFKTHKRCLLDMVFDGTKKSWDAANDICATARAVLIKTGKTIKIKVEQAGSPVQMFTMGNIIKDSFKIHYLSLKDRPNFMGLQFLNRDNNYEQDIIAIEDPAAFAAGEDFRKETASLYGITRPAQTYREATFRLNVQRYLKKIIDFEVGIDGIACEVGDIINFQHDVPQWGYGGRVVSATASTVKLDKPVTIAAGTYKVRVHLDDDTEEEKTVTDGAGTYTTLNISGSWTKIPKQYDVFAFGKENILVKPHRITEITSVNDLTRKISALEYNASVYDDDFGDIESLTYTDLPDPSKFPDDVTDLTLTEGLIAEQDGSYKHTVEVSFTLPQTNFTQANIWLKVVGLDYWQYMGSTKIGHFSIQENMGFNMTYEIAVASVSIYNTHKAAGDAPSDTITMVGQGFRPDDVTNLDLVRVGDSIYLTWDAVETNIDLKGYELRVGASWGTALIVGTNITERRFSTTNFAPGIQTFMVKAINNAGLYSENAALYLVTVDPRINDNVVLTRNEETEGYPGTKTNMTVNGDGDLELDAGQVTGSYITPSIDIGDKLESRVHLDFEAYQLDKVLTWAAATYAWSSVWATTRTIAGTGESLEITQTVEVAFSDNDVDWTDWAAFVVGEYSFRYIRFRISVTTTSTDYGYLIDKMIITIDVPDVFDSDKDVAITSAPKAILFSDHSKTFLIIPAIAIGIQNAATGDYYTITNKSVTGFTIEVFDSTDTSKNAVLDWVVRGY